MLQQNKVFGFIKFGSQMDILLPPDSEVLVEIGDCAVCTQTPIARLPVIAYSPVGEGKLLKHPVLKNIAEKPNATPAQIALAWIIRNPGVMAIPRYASLPDKSEDVKIHYIDCETLPPQQGGQ